MNFLKYLGIFLISAYGKLKGIWTAFLLFFLINAPYWMFSLIPAQDIINQSELSDTYNETDQFYITGVKLSSNGQTKEMKRLFLLMNKFGLCAGQNVYKIINSRYKVNNFKILFESTKITNKEITDGVSESEFSEMTKTCISDFGAFPKF